VPGLAAAQALSDHLEQQIMNSPNPATVLTDTAVSDRTLRGIVEAGFFNEPDSLAKARSACAELIFARSVIEAQTARITQLGG
jgi:hypothetical protein